MLPGLAVAQAPALPVAGFAAGGAGLTPFYVLGFELGPWQDYLARELTPDFMADPAAPPLHISWLDTNSVKLLPAFAEDLIRKPRTWTRFELDHKFLDVNNSTGFDASLASPGLGFEPDRDAIATLHEETKRSQG